ncbi:zinc-binding dehydrogenase [Rhizobium sp. KVB221]|uniref:enoyl-[acyl-carrier-protein] reductase n=1 Tax=Rhizobium setariae TaxID=2801340 RepID=A0A937CKS1_9HYPH|nr:zinc-binding dehydrogenase [Rhizobium setariae]MBL0372440.1 zinc-binding dehydrogenase [Rhizobium setariae]
MRSATHAVFGEPSKVLTVSDLAVPEPDKGQVRIKTILAPIHNHDVLTVAGQYGYKPPLPAIGGTEAVGLIDSLGEGVEGLKIGQRVAVASVHGTWAEYFIAPAAGVVPMPDLISDEVAAQLIAMPLSALVLLDFLKVQPGQWVIQNAATGAVAKVLAMIAKARGIHVVNLVRREDGVEELKALGIGNVVSTVEVGWQDSVRAIVGSSSIAAAVDGVGGTASGDLLSLVGEGGLLVSFGAMSGEPMQLSAGDMIFKQVTVKGFWLAKLGSAMPRAEMGRLIGELVQLAASGKIKLQVEEVFALENISDAVAAAGRGGRKGKVLLRP